MDKSKIIYDWFSFTSKIHSPLHIIEMLGLSGVTWQNISGANGYKDRLRYDKISIHFNGRDDMGVWCEMSGQGCRVFETHGTGDYESIFNEIHSNPGEMNITRLDVAYDDFDGLLDLDVIMSEVVGQRYVSRWRNWETTLSDKGTTIILGSKKSDVYVRIYDKARERDFTDGRHWVRFEVQLRDKLASNFAFLDMPIADKFVGVINNYLRFVVPTNDTNNWRWPTAEWWQNFVDSVLKIRIYEKPGTEYNELSLERYVFKQAGNSIYTYVACFGHDKFFDELKKRSAFLNPNQEFLINKYKGVFSDD